MIYEAKERGYIWLSLLDSVSIIKKYELLDAVGSVEELYENFLCHTNEIIEIVGNNNFSKLSYYIQDEIIDKEIEKIEKYNLGIVTIEDREYSELLRATPTPPLMLYYKGNIDLLNMPNKLAVVGSRRISRYGKDITASLVKDVARAGIIVVSGLARGVDTVAHRTTLEEDGKTIAVVANGLGSCYPEENHELMDMIEKKGLIVSEYPVDGVPYAYKFPERNRIISGLCEGTLVTEAGKNSGSLITLNSAIDQNREVYIVPCNINSSQGLGSNEALKKLQGAMVTNSEDIISHYDVSMENIEEEEEIPLTDLERQIVTFVKEDDRHIDEITAYIGDISVEDLLATLSKLELLGVIQRLPGNYYGK